MNSLWYKIWEDLRLHKARTLLAILSIAVGVFCVGTLFGMIDLQLSQMDEAHQKSQPSHINIILRQDADMALLPEILAIPGVSGLDTLSPISVRFRLKPQSDWEIGILVIRPEPSRQQYDISTLSSGAWPLNAQIAVEKLSSDQTGLHIGDSVEFDTADGIQILSLAGVVRHPFVKPPKFGGQVHFFGGADLADQFNIKADSFRQLLVRINTPYNIDRARLIASEIRGFLNDRHLSTNVTLLQDPGQHWGRPFFAGINNILKIMALTSLALACVLIFNTISAHITQETNQIGIMKSLGGKTGTIAGLYLIETEILALAAVLLAVPSALAAAHVSSCHLLGLFNIECKDFAYSTRAIHFMVLGGLTAPLLAALCPVLSGASMNVRKAIDSYGLGGDFGVSRFDLFIEGLGARFLSTLTASALGNLFRRKGRLLLTQIVLIIVGVVFMILLSLIASVNLTLDNEMARSCYSVRLGFPIDQPEQKILALAKSVAPTQAVELWQRLPIEMSKQGGVFRQKGSLGTQMLALPADSTIYKPLIESGRWFQSGDAGRRVLILSADTAKLNGIQAGDNIEIRLGALDETWQVIGLYRWLTGNNYAVEPVYAPLETVRKLLPDKNTASFALINAPIDKLAAESDYFRRLKQVFQDEHTVLDVYSTVAKLEQRQYARNQLNPVIGTLFGLAGLMAAVGGIGLSGTLAIGVLQRIREIGVLRAIGAPSQSIFRLFLLEGLFHGAVAWLISVPIAYCLAEPIARQLGNTLFGIQLDFSFPLSAPFYWLGIVLLLTLIASLWPAYQASRYRVIECLS